jgi:phosphate acetyltransferase
MSGVMEQIRGAAKHRVQRLLLAEGGDERVVRAADRIRRLEVADVAIVGAPEEVRATSRNADLSPGAVSVVDAGAADEIARTFAALKQTRGDRLTTEAIERFARDPLFQAATRVREGRADCFVAGAVRTTADVLRASLWLIGLAPGVKMVSSFFLMVMPDTVAGGGRERVMMFADCGVVPDPTAPQLAEIACLTADRYRQLTRQVPHTAFLSFSTRGSAEHPRVTKVREALALAREARPDLHFDGELQADAALDPGVAKRKAPDSVVAGHANVLIFPDLDSGNIGYKLVQRLGGARAYGPILMGLARQANDLSRGCSADDVVEVATIACALSAAADPVAPGARMSTD